MVNFQRGAEVHHIHHTLSRGVGARMVDTCRGPIHGEGFAPCPCGLAAPFSILRESVNTAIQIKSHWTHLPETGGNLALQSADALILPHRANPTGLNFRER